MEALADFLPLVFLVVYFLLGRKRKQIQQRQKQPTSPETGTRPPTPFEEFVRQMEDAMREASGTPATESAEPERVQATLQPPRPPALPKKKRPAPTPEFHDMGSFVAESTFESSRTPPHEIHGFGLDEPFSEERFERLARGQDETRHAHPSLAGRTTHRSAPPSRWRTRLQDPKQAQDALVLTEIFAGPWSPRRPVRRS